MHGDQDVQSRAWLGRDPLRQIVLLKHRQIYAGRISCHYRELDGHAGVPLLLPVAESSWDASHY
jgi:hypothetical protein